MNDPEKGFLDPREIAIEDARRLYAEYQTLGARKSDDFIRGRSDIAPEYDAELNEARQRWQDAQTVLEIYNSSDIDF